MYDAIAVSDLHLGSANCQAKYLLHFLAGVRRGETPTRRLILNGDVFDSFDFRRLKGKHWKILSELRKIAGQTEVVWVTGNHDGPAEAVSHLLGVHCADEFVVESGGRKILFLHGHQFDEFISRYPLLTRLADRAYRLVQRLDRSHRLARLLKRSSKTFLRSVDKVRRGAVEYALDKGCDAVCCGHTHMPVQLPRAAVVGYHNSGCWTERPCHFLTVVGGVVSLVGYTEEPADEAGPGG